ncbi:hypothetical protein ACIRRA_28100 [Nocardia sp. NPDC101769]
MTGLLREFGWRAIIDLGDISTARGTVPLSVRLMRALSITKFNYRLVR